MTINTKRSIGDTIIVDGQPRVIIGIQVYVSEKRITEHYYIGNEEWVKEHQHFCNKSKK